MIADALSGKIDLIITKSISRFARNILDTIQKVRELKAHYVEVFFEKENIWTFDSKSELIMTIMASIAQEESRSISENVKWGKKVAYQNGKFTIAYSSFLGYKKGEDGRIEIDETQAPLVREIYRLFLLKDIPLIALLNTLISLESRQLWVVKNGLKMVFFLFSQTKSTKVMLFFKRDMFQTI